MKELKDLEISRISIVSRPAIGRKFLKDKELKMEKQQLPQEVIDAIKKVLAMLGELIGYPKAPAKKEEDLEKRLAPQDIERLRRAIRILQDALGRYGYYIRPYYYGYYYARPRRRRPFYGYGYYYRIPGPYYRYPRIWKAVEAIVYDLNEILKDLDYEEDINLIESVKDAFQGAIGAKDGLRITESCQLLESYGEGKEWEVVLISAGLSKNFNYYPAEVLERSAHLFEGKKAYSDHATDRELKERPERSIRDVVGWFDNVRMENDKLKARFHVAASWLKEMLNSAFEQGKDDLIGFSIDSVGKVREDWRDGRRVRLVESIDHVRSIDVVTEPAAGGKIERLVASYGGETMEEEKDYEQMDEGDGVLTRLRELEEKIEQQEREKLLREVVEETNLPDPIKRKLRAQFKDQHMDEYALRNAVELERKTLADLGFRTDMLGLGKTKVEVTRDEKDKLAKAMDGLIEGHDVDGVPAFKSLHESFEVVVGKKPTGQLMLREAYGFSPDNPAYVAALRETTIVTSDWGQLLGDSITRKMIKEYMLPQLQDWRRICSSIVPIKDYRSNRRIIMGRFPNLPVVAENATYQETTKPTDDEVTYSIKKYGYHISLSEETLVNDDINAVRRIPRDMGRACARTVYDTIFGILKDNVTTCYDGKVIFHADHNNLGNVALSAGELSNVRARMMKQIAYGSTTERLGASNIPRMLLIPPELEDLASRLSKSKFWLGAPSGEEASTSPNIHYGIDYIVVDTFTDANDWYAVADPNNTPTIEVGFLNGREEPELLLQDQPNVGSVFFADKITYRVKIAFGYCCLDWRGMFKAKVS